MSTAPSLPGLQGALHPPYGNLLHGWVWHSGAPQRRWWVEILLEDITLAVVEARLYRSRLAEAGIGDGCHAFCFALPEAVWTESGRLSARLANTLRSLPGTYELGEPVDIDKNALPETIPLDGQLVIGDGGLHLHGWVNDPAQPGQSATLICSCDQRELCRATTDKQQRFTIALPLDLADGVERKVHLFANGRALPGSPARILIHRRGPRRLLRDLLERLDSGTPPPALAGEIAVLDRLLQEVEIRHPQGVAIADYQAWFNAFEAPEHPRRLTGGLIRVLIRHGQGLARTLASLLSQTHQNWRVLVIGLPDDATLPDDPRIQGQPDTAVTVEPDRLADDALLTFIEAGDHLPSQALAWVARTFHEHPIDALYTDCDEDDALGERSNPWFKPAWDFELFQGMDYLHHLFVVRAGLLKGVELSWLTDLPYLAVITLLNRSPQARPWHLPRVLYHRRYRAAFGVKMGERRRARLQALLGQHFPENPPEVLPHPSGAPALRQVRWPLLRAPRVSILIPTRDRLDLIKPCVGSLLAYTDYPNVEILILDNESREPETLDWLAELAEEPRCRVLPCPGPFNYSRINNDASRQCDGELLCLLNNDTLVPETSGHWLRDMVSKLLQPGVGAVGAKLLWANRMVQHAGIVLGVGGVAGHIGNLWMETDPGYRHLNQLARCASAVTAACLLTDRQLYRDLGGLNPDQYPVAFNDVDYCLRVRETGRRIVWTPFAPLFHLESKSRGLDHAMPEKQVRARREIAALQRRWTDQLAADPYYHPALSLYARQPPFEGLALPPRPRDPR
ncbi:hypothetical protein CCR95_04655 [Thiocystis minor]|uniref:glycosyltransferase family 2 protein n=1 Tax=Thiocystis minor TaxID=61597 RepID=UPI00191154F9|nr:glycosyltransferase [Thiocystis minor]MBK5963399.1 hypothetical protein [Thiocystis minor]